MNRTDPEFLLRELAQIPEPPEMPGGEPVPDELLAAYRAGTLGAAETERLERRLAASPEARERLAAAAGVKLDGPGERVRRAVLAREAAGSRPAFPGRRRLRAVQAAAAAALLAVAVGLVWRAQGPPVEAPPLPAFEISLAGGLASDRSAAVTASRIVADPHSRVTVAFRPQRAVAGLEFALYRDRGGRLERLHPGGAIRQVLGRGAAEWTARAADLVGDSPGTHTLWAVVAREGELPQGAGLQPAGLPGKGRLVRTLVITLRPPLDARGELP